MRFDFVIETCAHLRRSLISHTCSRRQQAGLRLTYKYKDALTMRPDSFHTLHYKFHMLPYSAPICTFYTAAKQRPTCQLFPNGVRSNSSCFLNRPEPSNPVREKGYCCICVVDGDSRSNRAGFRFRAVIQPRRALQHVRRRSALHLKKFAAGNRQSLLYPRPSAPAHRARRCQKAIARSLLSAAKKGDCFCSGAAAFAIPP